MQLGINLEALRQRVRRRSLKLGTRHGPTGPYRVVSADDLEKLRETPSTLNVHSTVSNVSRQNARLTERHSGAVSDAYRVGVYSTDESRVQSTQAQPSEDGESRRSENLSSLDLDENNVFEGNHECVESTYMVNVQPLEPNGLLQTLADVANKALDHSRQLEEKVESLREELAEARELKARAERQTAALGNQLDSYRRVLTEQAESLAEERAQRLALEQQGLGKATSQISQGQAFIPDRAIEQMPIASIKREVGWGRRLKRLFFGEKTG